MAAPLRRPWLLGAALVAVVAAVVGLTWEVGDRPDRAPTASETEALDTREGSSGDGVTAAEAASTTEAVGERASPGIITDPGEGVGAEDPGEPGGWQQALVFGVVVAGLAGVGFGIWRSARRGRRRADSGPSGDLSA